MLRKNGSKKDKYIIFSIGVWYNLYSSFKFKILSTNKVEPTVPEDITILLNLVFIFFLLSVITLYVLFFLILLTKVLGM